MRALAGPLARGLPLAAIATATAITLTTAARAQPVTARYSHYEKQSIAQVLNEVGGQIDVAPQGKIIERVIVVPLRVIEQRDPVPNFLNWFHVTSKDIVIRREVLERAGERYDQRLIDETCRNLRSKDQLSLVLCLPVQGTAPGRVRLVVVTKDVWSIRLNSNFKFADGKVESLLLQPTESNIAGTHQLVAANYDLELFTLALGAQYSNPRFWGSWISASANANIILNRFTGTPEGSNGAFNWGSPLYSARTAWAWGAAVAWKHETTRRFIGANLATYDAAVTPGPDTIPWVYVSDSLSGSYQVTRSFGLNIKHNFTLGAAASRNAYEVPDDPIQFTNPAAIAEFTALETPVSDTQIGPYVEYRTFDNRFMHALNLNTLGLQEDVQLGHDFFVKVQPVTKALHSTRDFVGVNAGVMYTVPLADGVARATTSGYLEVADGFPDAAWSAALRVETPTTPIGRLVLDGYVLDRVHNYLNTKVTLGGDTRLRGYPSSQLIGANTFSANLEYRSRSIDVLTVVLAGAAFFDVGDAFDSWSTAYPKKGVGFGLRAVLPQLNRAVFRVDLGFALNGEALPFGQPPVNLVATFNQAFNMPGISP